MFAWLCSCDSSFRAGGNTVGTCSFAGQADQIDANFFYGHGMYPQSFYAKITAACATFTTPLSAECNPLLDQMDNYVGDFYIYNICALPRCTKT